MNIFVFDKDPAVCGRALCSKHQKMILESAQLLSSAHHVLDKEEAIKGIYKLAHLNHPSTVWTRTNGANYDWLFQAFEAMLDEFERRGGRRHKSGELLILLKNKPKNIPKGKLQVPLVAMLEEFRLNDGKTWEDVIASYKNYYVKAKTFAAWLNTRPPEWFIEERAKQGSKMYTQDHPNGVEYKFTEPSSRKEESKIRSPLRAFLRNMKQ